MLLIAVPSIVAYYLNSLLIKFLPVLYIIILGGLRYILIQYIYNISYIYLVLRDLLNKVNIVYQSSVKCKRITRSILAFKLYAIAHGFDISAVIKTTVKLQLNISLLLILYTNFKLIYKCLIKLGTIQEKRFIIDVICLRQSYKRREIAKVKWINGDSNPADTITKSKLLSALK